MSAKNNQSLEIIVRKRDGVVFSGEAESATSVNDKGVFDVLPMHTNFVSMIKEKLTVRTKNGNPFVISLASGIIHVKENKVEVYIGI